MTSAGEIALQLQDQGWRGLLPLLPHDATPHIRLALERRRKWPAAEARRRDGGRGQGGRCCPTGARIRTMRRRSRGGPVGPASTSGMRACHAAPWVAFIDVDVLHAEAAAEMQVMLRRCLASKGEFLRASVTRPSS